MVIIIKDSGKGFDPVNYFSKKSDDNTRDKTLSGRGIELVEQLCDSLEYQENGTHVEATYVWSQ